MTRRSTHPRSTRHRTPFAVLAPLAAVALLTGCSTFDSDVAASVDGAELTIDELEELVTVLGTGDPSDANAVRSTLQVWVLVELADQVLAEADVELTDDDLTAAEQQLSASLPGFIELDEDTRDYLVTAQARLVALDSVPNGNDVLLAVADEADVHVKSRLGTFDPEFGVLPLG